MTYGLKEWKQKKKKIKSIKRCIYGGLKLAMSHLRGTFLISTQRNEQTLREALHHMLMSSALETVCRGENTIKLWISRRKGHRCLLQK